MTIADQQASEFNNEIMTWDELFLEANEIGIIWQRDIDAGCAWFEFADRSVSVFNYQEKLIVSAGMRKT